MISDNKLKGTILIVDDTPANIGVLAETLSHTEFKVLVANDGESAIAQLKYSRPDLILLDVMMPGISGFQTCEILKKNTDTKDIPVIFMTSLSDTHDKVKGFQAGAVDYITKPFQSDEVISRVNTHLTVSYLQRQLKDTNNLLEQKVADRTKELQDALTKVQELKNQLEEENLYLWEEMKLNHKFEEIVTQSDNFKQVLKKVEQVAATEATVLIQGESGTGKELLARAIHYSSQRKSKPFIKINCAVLPANIIESELFGHEKGAFTGAINRRIGRFELADNGTIFLDEIGELPLELQAKLLRVLQEGEFERIGSSHTIKVNVRVVAATNRDLLKEVEKKEFRADLYYRLNVFPIVSPPLRERKEDIPVLVNHFCRKHESKVGKKITVIPKRVIDALQSYNWPGNIRELENIIERAMILSPGNKLELGESLPKVQSHSNGSIESLAEIERNYILAILDKKKWKVSGENGAAKALGLKATTLEAKMKKLGIVRES